MLKTSKNLKYIILLVIFGITFGLWGYTKIYIQNQSLWDDLLSSFVQLLGLFAVILFGINFLLATRFYFIESLFGGLDKMYKFHKIVARIAFTLAWAHPLLLVVERFSSLETVKRYFIPGENVRWNVGMFALYLMTLLVLFSVTKFLPYHIWKRTHKFMVLVMVFLFIHIIDAPGSIRDNIMLKLWILGWIILAICCWLYVEFLYTRIGPVLYYKVVKINKLGTINELYLEPQNKPITFFAGQFAFITFLNNKEIDPELHPFSLSSNPHEYHVRLSAKSVGDYTSTLHKAKLGDMVKLIGPYGYFTRERIINYKNQIWIAGGIGVTPFLSMLAAEKDEPTGNKINLFYSTKTKEELVYKDELTKGSENLTDLKLNFNVDSESGFLTADKIKTSIDFDIKDAHVLLCGPKVMMYSLRKQFMDMGLKNEQIIFEDFALKPV